MTRARKRSAALWLLAGGILWLALRDVDWQGVASVLGALSLSQILILLGVNGAIVLLFGVRWWLILRAMGGKIPFLAAAAYRLASFSVSYFTPGPHFGGEPLQIYLAVRRDGVAAGTAAAAVMLDRLFELAANFAFLAFGTVVLLSGGLLRGSGGPVGLALSIGLLMLPLIYFTALARGYQPLSNLLKRFPPDRFRWQSRLIGLSIDMERQATVFFRNHHLTFLAAVILSGIVWAALIYEYGLLTGYFGLDLSGFQLISVITAARVAILLPMPGGLGTLEAALVFTTRALGEGAALGAGISLFIRARDIIFGLAGLWLGRHLLPAGGRTGE